MHQSRAWISYQQPPVYCNVVHMHMCAVPNPVRTSWLEPAGALSQCMTVMMVRFVMTCRRRDTCRCTGAAGLLVPVLMSSNAGLYHDGAFLDIDIR